MGTKLVFLHSRILLGNKKVVIQLLNPNRNELNGLRAEW